MSFDIRKEPKKVQDRLVQIFMKSAEKGVDAVHAVRRGLEKRRLRDLWQKMHVKGNARIPIPTVFAMTMINEAPKRTDVYLELFEKIWIVVHQADVDRVMDMANRERYVKEWMGGIPGQAMNDWQTCFLEVMDAVGKANALAKVELLAQAKEVATACQNLAPTS